MERPVQSTKIFRFGLFEADVGRNVLTRAGLRVKIQDQPFRALILLLERPGEVVAREELRQNLWPEGTFVDFDGSLNVILKKLRAAVGDDPENPRFIETVPKHGYRFIAPVSVQGEKSPPAASQDAVDNLLEPARISPTPTLPPAKRPRYLIYVALVALAIGIVATWLLLRRGSPVTVVPNQVAPAAPPAMMRKSIAVLGFRDIS